MKENGTSQHGRRGSLLFGYIYCRIFYLEEKFDIEIPLSLDNSELDFLTVGDVLKAVNTLTRKAQ